MVKTTLTVILVALAGIAHASPPPPDDYVETSSSDDEPAFNMLGFRIGIGALPIENAHTTTFSLGLAVEHPVFTKTRVFGEYEWMWLMRVDERAMLSMSRPQEHGSGHRTVVGLRRELKSKKISRGFSLFLDSEIGGGVALVNDNMLGAEFLPTAFLGVRGGYDFYSRNDDSPSRTFEAEFLLRAIAIEDGIGMMFGIGMFWGN